MAIFNVIPYQCVTGPLKLHTYAEVKSLHVVVARAEATKENCRVIHLRYFLMLSFINSCMCRGNKAGLGGGTVTQASQAGQAGSWHC